VSVSSDSKTGFLAGGVLDIGFMKYFSLEPGIQYSGRGGSGTDESVTYTDNLSYLAIPVNAKVKLPITPIFTPYVLAGLNVGFLLGATETVGSTSTSGTSGLNTMDFGFDLGFGSEFNVGNLIPFVDLGWYIGVANIASNAPSGYSSTNHGFEVKAGLKFKT